MELQVTLILLGAAVIVGVWAYNAWQERKLRKKLQTAFSKPQHDVLLDGLKPTGTAHANSGRGDQYEPLSETPAYQRVNYERVNYDGTQTPSPAMSPVIAAELASHHAATARHEPSLAAALGDDSDNTIPAPWGNADAFADTQPLAQALTQPLEKIAVARPVNPIVSAPPAGVLDAVIDCMITARPERPISGDHLIVLAQRYRHAGAKPVVFEGLLQGTTYWTRPRPGDVYEQVRVGVLLANRSGALNAIEFSDFMQIMEKISDELGFSAANTDAYPDMQETLAAAQALDQICARVDVQMGLSVAVPENTFNLTALQTLLESEGLTPRPDGKYAWLDEAGRMLFVVAVNVAAPQFSFLLDLPRVPAESQPYARMTEKAKLLAAKTNGMVVDDNQRPLSEQGLQSIGQQLDVLYEEMRHAEIPAGSALAIRVFS